MIETRRASAFLADLDDDLRTSTLGMIRDLWTHESTAIEGNTLTLAETRFVLSEGLTVKGKPLRDHNEVMGHARAIDRMLAMLGRSIIEEDVFALHLAVQTEAVADIMRPNGQWKREPNGAWTVLDSGERRFVEFAHPEQVPERMGQWLSALNGAITDTLDGQPGFDVLVGHYARLHIEFTRIHPFWDGNGRLARLLSNLPILNAGYPPLVIANEDRQRYIQLLSALPDDWRMEDGDCADFTGFCRSQYRQTESLIDEAMAIQRKREHSP